MPSSESSTVSPSITMPRGRPLLPHERLGPQRPRYAPPLPARRERYRIAIVTPEVGAGAGVPHYWRSLALALSATHEVHVFAGKTDGVAMPGVQFHRLPVAPGGWCAAHATFFAAAQARFALDRLRRAPPFDIVLGIGALTPFADVATVHFVQAREMDLDQHHLFPSEHSRTGLDRLDYALYSRAMAWLGRRFYRRTKSVIVAISNSVKADLALLEGAPQNAMVVVPNGVDTERFHPRNRERFRAGHRAELGITDRQTAVLFVGNSWGRKGLHTAIEAIRGPGEANLRLIVVGDGRAAPFIEALPADVVGRIIFAGMRTADVERFYAAADVFMLPTHYEPFGLVILEALASGLPTIASACAGASEWLEDGKELILLQDPADGAEARAALRSITEDPVFAANLAANGQRAAARLEWSGVAERLVSAVTQRAFAPGARQEGLADAP